jgi:hypothetical protein
LGGDVDDGLQVDAAAAGIVAGNHTIGTFCAWIMVPDNTGTYTFFGTGDANAVEYTTFGVEAGTVCVLMIKAGPTTEIDVNTPANSIKANTWHHVAIVQDGVCMKIYIDGVLQTLTWTTETNRAQWYSDLNNIDGAHIGAADSVAGGALLTQEWKGYIGDVRLFSGTTSASALTAAQVEQVMSGQTVGSPYNSWSLNRTLVDTGSGADNATIVGALIYVDANEFVCKLTFTSYVLIAATNISMCASNGTALALFVPSA